MHCAQSDLRLLQCVWKNDRFPFIRYVQFKAAEDWDPCGSATLFKLGKELGAAVDFAGIGPCVAVNIVPVIGALEIKLA